MDQRLQTPSLDMPLTHEIAESAEIDAGRGHWNDHHERLGHRGGPTLRPKTFDAFWSFWICVGGGGVLGFVHWGCGAGRGVDQSSVKGSK